MSGSAPASLPTANVNFKTRIFFGDSATREKAPLTQLYTEIKPPVPSQLASSKNATQFLIARSTTRSPCPRELTCWRNSWRSAQAQRRVPWDSIFGDLGCDQVRATRWTERDCRSGEREREREGSVQRRRRHAPGYVSGSRVIPETTAIFARPLSLQRRRVSCWPRFFFIVSRR